MLGLPDAVHACLFDLDGVLTDTASVHTKAWKAMFDEYLRQRAERTGEEFVPFDPGADYRQYVDGKKREDGVRSFLASRGIELPEGSPDDPPTPKPFAAWATAKTKPFNRLCGKTVSRCSTAPGATWRRSPTPVSASRLCRRAPTPETCSNSPGSTGSSSSWSTA
ncbi:putative glucose-1-phosphate phosphodismutase beta-phosphoglucomutase [Mycobacterium xenopi 4042]|uniref:Putative glucose-1-phosphate phosphodismutase beta-phosphoglucomutase n=1 Tax=Mycobacterium xenopi 4042 TaxID=1299334 RepID=X7YK65_MYCXE|nr:putative glucose-1-phosphate phosphodismutase beta-phosphoglucomutase [Mycobacterium xenopi 4042]EUA52791.1 putative glucose-1-phosphate phosphodismutase beta-phosphoglucomutase [Mycobacterium xenopi 3993]